MARLAGTEQLFLTLLYKDCHAPHVRGSPELTALCKGMPILAGTLLELNSYGLLPPLMLWGTFSDKMRNWSVWAPSGGYDLARLGLSLLLVA